MRPLPPGDYGADVCHLNLHKTFCIPHGGGVPASDQSVLRSHLVPFLPAAASLNPDAELNKRVGPVRRPLRKRKHFNISWMYIRMMGGRWFETRERDRDFECELHCKRLDPHFPVLFKANAVSLRTSAFVDLRHGRPRALSRNAPNG